MSYPHIDDSDAISSLPHFKPVERRRRGLFAILLAPFRSRRTAELPPYLRSDVGLPPDWTPPPSPWDHL